MLLVVALGFNALLSLNSLEKLYERSIVSQFNVVGVDLKKNIEKALYFGKKIDTFIGIHSILEAKKKYILSNPISSQLQAVNVTSLQEYDITISIVNPEAHDVFNQHA